MCTGKGSRTLRRTFGDGSEFDWSEGEGMDRVWKEVEGYWAPGSGLKWERIIGRADKVYVDEMKHWGLEVIGQGSGWAWEVSLGS